ncbi:MAG: hypothetical protein H6740_13280 [Alphaproteobacteria bacterium]|nr:hypothetical protein [Alphaproteobacteria bacterium]
MTPTLSGRWQTRIALMTLLGVPLTLPFCLLALLTVPPSAPVPLFMLGVVLGVGLALDPLYDRSQRGRWDHDWPVHVQLLTGLLEGLLSFILLFGCCGGVALLNPGLLLLFPIHYLLVWGSIFLFLQGPIRVLFPRWRYRGGEIL